MLALILVALSSSWPATGSVALLGAQPADAALDEALLRAAPDVFDVVVGKDAIKRAERDAAKLGIRCAVDDAPCFAKIGVLAHADIVVVPSPQGAFVTLVAVDVVSGKEIARGERFAKKDAANALRALKSPPAPLEPPPTPLTATPAATPAPVAATSPVAIAPTAPPSSPAVSSKASHAGFLDGPLGLTSAVAAGVAGVAGVGALAAELTLASPAGDFGTRSGVWWGGRGALAVAAASGVVAIGAGIPALLLE